jgi:DNA-binding transcriptional ArsR family regulator
MKKNKYYRFFNNLSNPLRIEIIDCLKQGEKSVGEISSALNVEQSKLSHALLNLKSCHIVEVEKRGKKRFYSLNKKTILPILKIIDNHAKNNCNNFCCFCK